LAGKVESHVYGAAAEELASVHNYCNVDAARGEEEEKEEEEEANKKRKRRKKTKSTKKKKKKRTEREKEGIKRKDEGLH
jgi:hypothetical protein